MRFVLRQWEESGGKRLGKSPEAQVALNGIPVCKRKKPSGTVVAGGLEKLVHSKGFEPLTS